MLPAVSVTQWVCWSLAGVLVLAAAGVVVWALFSDGRPFVRQSRRLTRRRCPRCWYDMAQAHPAAVDARVVGDHTTLTPRYVCPECGKSARGVCALQRTRRRWKRLPIALVLLCLAWQTALIGTPGREGWRGLVPTAWYLLTVDDFSSKEAWPLVSRLSYGAATPWDKWLASQRELSLAKIDWNTLVTTREKWPIDEPVRLWVDHVWTTVSYFEGRTVRIRSEAAAGQEGINYISPMTYCGCGFGPRDPYWIDLPPPRLGENTYEIEVSIAGRYGTMRRRRVSVRVEGVRTIGESIDLRDDPVFVEDFTSVLAASGYFENMSMVAVRQWERTDFWDSVFNVPYQLELLRDGRVVARPKETEYAYMRQWADVDALAEFDTATGEWWLPLDGLIVRITPDYRSVLHDQDETSCWSGVIEMPLRDVPFTVDGTRVRLHPCVDRLPMNERMLTELLRLDADPID